MKRALLESNLTQKNFINHHASLLLIFSAQLGSTPYLNPSQKLCSVDHSKDFFQIISYVIFSINKRLKFDTIGFFDSENVQIPSDQHLNEVFSKPDELHLKMDDLTIPVFYDFPQIEFRKSSATVVPRVESCQFPLFNICNGVFWPKTKFGMLFKIFLPQAQFQKP